MDNRLSLLQKKVYFSVLFFLCILIYSQEKSYKVVAYISSDSASLVKYDLKKVTHLIYGFGNLNDKGRFSVRRKKDTVMLNTMRDLKVKYPQLKTLIAFGGWGGCKTCSEVFSTTEGRQNFAQDAKAMMDYFGLDGVDLDWEYPAIQGPPEHLFQREDKANFTDLITRIRKEIGQEKLLTFAAGGFQQFLDESVEWDKILTDVDFVNLMTYDLVHGYSTETGHQSSLYSVRPKDETINRAIDFFKKTNFPLDKVIVGVPFYHRYFTVESSENNGLFKPTKFLKGVDYKDNHSVLGKGDYQEFWDSKASVPYWYNSKLKIFVTGDNKKSIIKKTEYIKKQKLGGIMFWELASDTSTNGLLDAINF